MAKILVCSRMIGHAIHEPLRWLEARGHAVDRLERLSQGDGLGGYDALLVGAGRVTRAHLASADRLRVIAAIGAGIDHIDVEAATEHGIPVTFVPSLNAPAVAELAMGLILALARQIPYLSAELRAGRWTNRLGASLSGSTLGLVGAGAIAEQVMKRACAFDMSIIAHSRRPKPRLREAYGVAFVDLATVVREADFVSLHCPLTEDTRHLIGERELRAMKPTAFLVNTARAEIVDPSALMAALVERRIAGAALDVFAVEPAVDDPLTRVDTVIATPHIGAFTSGALTGMGMAAARDALTVLEGGMPPHSPNASLLVEGRTS